MKNAKTIEIYAVINEEHGEWLDWWIEATDPQINVPYWDDQVEAFLSTYDTIIVGDKTFSGREAEAAIKAAYDQYR